MSWKPDQIPVVYPIAALKIKAIGRTQPLEMRCDTGHSAQDYVVKLWNNVELKTNGLAREIYGCLLANFFGLNTPKIALVDIPSDFAISQPDGQIRKHLQNSPGLNFGSQYIQGAVVFVPPLHHLQRSVATRIFCFDMLIGNVDRCKPRINIFKAADNFILYDHEQAFPFSQPQLFIGGHPPAWKFIHEPWSKQHVFYPGVKGEEVSLEIEEFIGDLAMLNDDLMATIEEQIPLEWQSDINNLSGYLADARDNANLFKRSLQELLA